MLMIMFAWCGLFEFGFYSVETITDAEDTENDDNFSDLIDPVKKILLLY